MLCLNLPACTLLQDHAFRHMTTNNGSKVMLWYMKHEYRCPVLLKKMTGLRKTHFLIKWRWIKGQLRFFFFFCINDPVQLFNLKKHHVVFLHQVTWYLLTTTVEVCTVRSFVGLCVSAAISHLCFTPSSARVQSALRRSLNASGGESGLSPAWSLPKSHLQTCKVMTPRRNN